MINTGYGNLGTNVGHFYSSLNVANLILLFFLLPETGRLSLEAIDDIFASHRPAWKTSLKRNKHIAKGEEFCVSKEGHQYAMRQMPEKHEQ